MWSLGLWKLSVLLPGVLGTNSSATHAHTRAWTPAWSGASSNITATSPTIFSSNSTPASTSSTPAVITGTRSIIPVVSYSFTPFPTPTQPPIPGVYPATDPTNPPPVDDEDGVVPNFSPAWAIAYRKARVLIRGWTLEEKVQVTTGVGWANGRCVGNIPAIRDWPGLCLQDSPLGVRFADLVTAFPASINAAATWNRDMIRKRGLLMAREHVGKGVNIALGPMMNLARVAQGGRNWEGFGADPYLSGESAYETILGLQAGGVQACAKHYINNEQEHSRTSSSSDVNDRTQHEIYAHPFLRSVMAGVTSVMCSYNLVNDTYACENDKMLNGILKDEFGFQGFVMSDWSAQHSTLSAVAGLDMSMPGDITFNSGDSYFGGNLTAYVQNGTIPLSRVEDMATRIIASWYLLHQDIPTFPSVNFDAFRRDDDTVNEHVEVEDDHYVLVRRMGAASTVLLKNTGNALPLRGTRNMVLIGSDAGPGTVGPNEFSDQGGVDGTLAMGWGSGTADFSYRISPLEGIQRRARQDRTSVSWFLKDFDLTSAARAATRKSAALVFIQSDSGEQYITVDGNVGDRNNLTAWHGGDDLIRAVAAHNNNTIVVVHTVGPLIVEPWIDHPNVTAVLWAGLPGTETGNALADIIFGDWNPSGRLPYTIAKRPQDYPAQIVAGSTDVVIEIPYTEGLFIDYRHFDANNITPRFPFGFGLSYTTFKYSGLRIGKIGSPDGAQHDLEENWDAGNASVTGTGTSTALWLHRPAFDVRFYITNTGSRYGSEIPQLYVHFPADSGEPPSVLRGFTNVELQPGETKEVILTLSRYDLSMWDVMHQGWRRPTGSIHLTVGAHSRDPGLQGEIPLGQNSDDSMDLLS